jgi:small conductance mechanosensitive channel
VFENPNQNYTTSGRRRIDIRAGASYGDDLEKVRRIAVRALEQVSARKADTDVEFFFEELGESSIDFVARLWIDFTSKQNEYLAARSEAIERLKSAFDENGITFPFPIRTLDFGVRGGEKLSEVLEEAGIGTRTGNGGSRPTH